MSQKENNPKLKESLRTLTVAVGPLFQKTYSDKSGAVDRIVAFIKFEKEVRKRKDFGHCATILSEDVVAAPLFGCLVGTKHSRTIVESPDVCITSFVIQIWSDISCWNEDVFEDHYQRFEELFYSSSIRLKSVVRLHRFKSIASDLEFDDGVAIRHVPVERGALMFGANPSLMFTTSDFVLERTYLEDKIVGDDDGTVGEASPVKTGEIFDDVIRALRVLKTSGVYRDSTIQEESLTFHPHGGEISMSSIWGNEVAGQECVLDKDGAAQTYTLYQSIRAEDQRRFRIACNRLSSGMTRPAIEDKLVDYMVGLEALYLPGFSQEISLRLSLRVARTLEKDRSVQKSLFEFVRGMYTLRNALIHGEPKLPSKHQPTAENSSRVEEILRKSLKLWLDDKTLFSKKSLDGLDVP